MSLKSTKKILTEKITALHRIRLCFDFTQKGYQTNRKDKSLLKSLILIIPCKRKDTTRIQKQILKKKREKITRKFAARSVPSLVGFCMRVVSFLLQGRKAAHRISFCLTFFSKKAAKGKQQ